MALTTEQTNLIKRFDDATNAVAAKITDLVAQVAAGGLTPELQAAFDVQIAKLEALGANPQNPVPSV